MDFRKIAKFLFTAGLLFAVAYFAITVFFPAPDRLQAYNNTFSLITNEDYLHTKESSESLVALMQDKVDALQTGIDLELQNKLEISLDIMEANQVANSFMLLQLAFAQNNPTYNEEVKELDALLEQMQADFTNLNAYVETYVDPFLITEGEQTSSTINTYANAILNYNLRLAVNMTDYTSRLITIYETLSQNFTNNVLSQKMLQITNLWINCATEKLGSEELNLTELDASVEYLKDFTALRMQLNYAHSYYTTQATAIQNLQNIENAETSKIISIIGTSEEQSYIDSVEDATIKQANIDLLAILKGDVL